MSLRDRLPEDLRETAAGVHFDSVPFRPLYRTDDEFAAELSNRTVHSVMHLAWVADGVRHFHGEMAVYVKPRGALGAAYMTLIKPFRYLIVYPALLRQLERSWIEYLGETGRRNASAPSEHGAGSQQPGRG
jgi:hypothetical protein